MGRGDVMRRSRLALAGGAVLALLGGLNVGAVAQDPILDPRVTLVSGTVTAATPDTSDEEWWVEDAIGHARVYKVSETVEWSDPRLGDGALWSLNFDMYEISVAKQMPVTGTVWIQGPDGHWTGTSTGFCDPAGDCYSMIVLNGQDTYDGLFATILGTGDGDTSEFRYEGMIFEGEMPPMPEPVKPPAE
jgi:hypothetical protein